MEPRYRTRGSTRLAAGHAKRVQGGSTTIYIQQNTRNDVYRSSTIDYTGEYSDHNFTLERVTKTYENLNYRTNPTSQTSYNEYKDYDIHGSRAVGAHIALDSTSASAAMSKAMARTNPSRAVVSVPTFIGELKDFPSLIRQGGNLALKLKKRSKRLRRGKRLKEAADTYLAYKFAIAPMISDLQKLMNFQQSAQQRMDELDRLYSKGGLKRRVFISSDSGSTSQQNVAVESTLSAVVRCNIDTSTHMDRWCTLRWTPILGPGYSNDKEKEQLAQRLVLGLNAHSLVTTAWELLPWSWMIDWFSNCQDLIEGHNNTVPAIAIGRCTMTHYYTTISYRRSDNIDSLSGGSAMFTRESKYRVIGGGDTFEAHFPLFSGNQLSILGALSVSKLSR